MNRRSVIKTMGASGLVAILGGGYWLTRHRDHPELTVDLGLQRLSTLDPDTLKTTGAWETTRVFNHLAQSIEFSMTGYPVMKSTIFQNTVGRLAFSVFQARGQMSHSLSESIPGEVIQTAPAPAAALQRLISALERFDSFDGTLRPHFAYGTLDKSQYAIAHVMHVNNHWQEFRL